MQMEDWKKFFIENSSQIWTLVSVIVGGLITYVSTTTVENRKIKRQAQKENLTQVLVPYCTCLENTINELNTIYQGRTELYVDDNFVKWLNTLNKPLEYLNAAKRVYLSQVARKKLQQYKHRIESFDGLLEKECTHCLIEYKQYISDKLENFPNLPPSMLITFSMDKVTYTKTKIAILNKGKLSLLNNFTCIDFVKNDDPDNYKYTAVNINKSIRETWGGYQLWCHGHF